LPWREKLEHTVRPDQKSGFLLNGSQLILEEGLMLIQKDDNGVRRAIDALSSQDECYGASSFRAELGHYQQQL